MRDPIAFVTFGEDVVVRLDRIEYMREDRYPNGGARTWIYFREREHPLALNIPLTEVMAQLRKAIEPVKADWKFDGGM